MKLFARPNSFFEMMTLVIYINYAVGLRVFEFPCGHPRSRLSLIYFLFLYVIYYIGALSVDAYLLNITHLKLDYILYKIMGYFSLTSVLLKMTMGWRHSKQVAVCQKKIFEIDKTLRQLGVVVSYDRMYFMMTGIIIVLFFYFTVMYITGFLFFRTQTNTLHALYIMFTFIISIIMDYNNALEFYVFTRCLQTKFKLINHLLHEIIRNLSMQKTKLGTFELKNYTKLMDFEQQKNIFSIKMISQWSQRINSASNFVLRKQSPSTSQIKTHIPFSFKTKSQNKCWIQSHQNISTIKCKNPLHLLQVTKQVHLELCKVSKLISSAFGLQIVWEIGLVIISVIHTLYNLYSRYIVQIFEVSIIEICLTLMIISISILKIFLLSRACKNAADEGNKTAEFIHITYGSNTDIDIQEEMQQFGIQIIQSPVIFNVFGLTMDNQVLNMIIRTITTYMVIMIQVGSSLESNSDIKDIHF